MEKRWARLDYPKAFRLTVGEMASRCGWRLREDGGEVRVCTIEAAYGPGYSDVTWLYRLAIAFAHGKPWALHATSMGPDVPSGTAGVLHGTVAASDLVVIGTTLRVTDAVEAAVADLERYLGSGAERWFAEQADR
jgi:hypothetical protein